MLVNGAWGFAATNVVEPGAARAAADQAVAIARALAVPIGIALRSEPFYLENTDPLVFVAALMVFAAAAAVAALGPACLVLRRNPVDALRHS